MKKIMSSIFMISALFACSSNDDDLVTLTRATYDTYEECTNIPRPKDTYVYPVYPGSSTWQKLIEESNGDMRKIRSAMQVPEKTLKNMSTEGIIQTWLDYPFSMELSAFNAYIFLIERDFYELNFCKELLRRDDAGACIINMYSTLEFGCLQANTIHTHLALLTAIPDIQNKLSISEKKNFVKIALNTYERSRNLTNFNGSASAFLCSNLMKGENYAPIVDVLDKNTALKEFVDFWPSGGATVEQIATIMELANNFIK
ncbi:MAG: hypothetical protein IJL37_02485 [Bacteroidaceae bacterium]|nr:hypothetical protein [Bacteroidaceae bacterium]